MFVISSVAALTALYDQHEQASVDAETLIESNSVAIRKKFDGISNMGKPDRLKYATAEIADMRKRVLATSDEKRTNLVKEIMGWERRVSKVSPLFDSPAAILTSVGTGTPEYANYREELAAAGPAEITKQAGRAILTKDKLLARAVMARVDALPRETRQKLKFSRQSLAEASVGQDFKICQDAFLRAKRLSSVAVARFRAMNSGKPMIPMNKISAALAKRKETGESELQAE